MQRRAFLLGVGLVSLKFSTAWGEESAIHWRTQVTEGWQEAQANERPLLVFVSKDGCKFCRKMERETLRDPHIAEQIEQSFVPIHITASKDNQLVRRLGIKVYPTTVIISPQNRVLDSIRGYVPPEQLERRLATIARAQDDRITR